MLARRYDAPSGRVRWCFVYMLAAELTGVRQLCWNADRVIVFQTVILQCARHLTSSGEIQRRINLLLDAWESGEFGMLAEDTAQTCTQYLSTSMGEDTSEHREKIFYSLVIRDKLRSSVQWITNREKSGVLQLGDI